MKGVFMRLSEKILFLFLMAFTALVLQGCSLKDTPTFSVIPDANTFRQSPSTLNNKIDVLWVVDNSGSMSPLQTTLTNAFNSFIKGFQQKNYDFHMAVTTTDAYLGSATYNNNMMAYARWKDGLTSHDGVYVMTPLTPNLTNIFVNNATVGSGGSGDERAFQSFQTALSYSVNADFRRPNAYLAIIILSDEDDFSNPTRCEGCGTDHNYNQTGLETISSAVTWLDQLTASTGAQRRYNVSAIAVLDINTCKPFSTSIQGLRYQQLVQATNGVLGSVCDSTYDAVLNSMQQHIAELSTQFFLDRQADPASISVVVNGVSVPQNATNGWTYDSASNSITFHGSAVPAQGAMIQVNYQPLAAQ